MGNFITQLIQFAPIVSGMLEVTWNGGFYNRATPKSSILEGVSP